MREFIDIVGGMVNETTRPKDRWQANEILLRSGYELLGSGSFATVYEKPGASYVLKLFDADDDAYMAFVALARQHPNEHFPKLIGNPVRVSPGFNAIRMERLSPYRGDPRLFDVYAQNRDRTLDPRGYTASEMSDADEIFYETPSLKVALDLMIDKLTPKYRFDIWAWNLMMRGSTIVFTDPVANLNSQNTERHIIPMPYRPVKQQTPKPISDRLNAILDDDALMRELTGEGLMADEERTVMEHTKFFGGFTRTPTSADTQRYMRGWCPYFALALHDMFGWQIIGCGNHFAAQRPDGMMVDIRGVMTPEDFQDGINSHTVEYSRDDLIQDIESGYFKCGFYSDRDLEKARAVVRKLGIGNLGEAVTTIPHHAKDEDELDQRMQTTFGLPGGGGMAKKLGTIHGYEFVGRWPLIAGNNFFLVDQGKPIVWLSTKAVNPYTGSDMIEQRVRFLFIQREYRRQGLGLAIYTDLIRRGMVLYCDDRQTIEAQALWKKLGTVVKITVEDVGDGQLVARAVDA